MKNFLLSTFLIGIVLIISLFGCGERPNGFLPQDSTTKVILESISFTLPKTTPEWALGSTECIKHALWFDENGTIQRSTILEDSHSFTLKLAKNCLTPIVVVYSTVKIDDSCLENSIIAGNIAGCIYPHSTDITWLNGFSAFILFRIFTGINNSPSFQSDVRRYCSYFNWWKFENTIAEMSSKYGGNPWMFDSEKIIKSIVSGTFTKNSIKVLQ